MLEIVIVSQVVLYSIAILYVIFSKNQENEDFLLYSFFFELVFLIGYSITFIYSNFIFKDASFILDFALIGGALLDIYALIKTSKNRNKIKKSNR